MFLPVRLETARLLLRPLRASDAKAIFDYASDPKVARHVRFATHRSLADSRQFLRHVHDRRGKDCVWGIVTKETHRLIGTVGLLDCSADHRRAEIGYALHRDYWNQGIATEAVRAIVRHALRKMALNRLEAGCYVGNPASQRVLEKCGFSFEGVLRQREYIKGRYPDQKFYSLLRSDL